MEKGNLVLSMITEIPAELCTPRKKIKREKMGVRVREKDRLGKTNFGRTFFL